MGYWERLRRPVPFEVLEDPAGGTTLLHAEEDQVHGCAKLPLGDCGIRRTMDKAAEREEILQSAIAGVRRVAQAIAALPEGTRSAPSRPRNAPTSRRCAIWSILMTWLARGCRR
jgi:hypothetical protein